jgi:hypothetical protein
MARSCAGKCCLAIVSNILQGIVAILFIGCCFWFASLILTPVRIIGITQLPPGIKYVQHDSRF